MIEFSHEKDKRRFMKRNLQVAKQAELEAEGIRLRLGFISAIRRPLIDKQYGRAAITALELLK